MTERTMVEAINLALAQEMDADDTVVVLGEDVGRDGGIFRVTDGLLDEYGEERVIDTPLAEAVIVGSSVGMAIAGLRPVCELQFSGFSFFAFHQIEGHVARMRWRSQGRFPLPMVVRMPYGAGVRALEHHSESMESVYAHVPGLKTVIPSGPRNARSLLISAIRDPDPVVFLEPKRSYRSFREEVPDDEETMEIGLPRRVREGEDLTIVTYGAMLRVVLDAVEELESGDGITVDVIDLLTISPLDADMIVESVEKTGRAMVVTEAHRSFGPHAEIVRRLVEDVFWYLEAPIETVTGYDIQVPYFAREMVYLPDRERIVAAARRVLDV
jgi:pyruvate dehydrogenase E1 component beta subunit